MKSTSVFKKLSVISLCLLVLCAVFSFVIFATEGEANITIPDYMGSAGPESIWVYEKDEQTLYIRGKGAIEYEYRRFNDIKYEVKRIVIEEGIDEIGPEAFYEFTMLTEVEFPSTLRSIKRNAFDICYSLTSIEFPSGLLEIGYQAFSDSPFEETIVLPESLEILSEKSFSCARGGFLIDEENPHYFTKDGSVYTKDGKTLVLLATPEDGKKLYLDERVESVPYYLDGVSKIVLAEDNAHFTLYGGVLYNKEMTEILAVPLQDTGELRIASTLLTLRSRAFSECSFSEIYFDDNCQLKVIPIECFIHFDGAKSFTLPSSIEIIEQSAFSFSAFETIEFEENTHLTHIPAYAFAHTTNLKKIVVPSFIETIGDEAFGNSGIEFADFGNNEKITYLPRNCFKATANLREIIWPRNIETIGDSAFSECGALEKIEFPSTIKTIERTAFSNCKGLREIVWSPSIQTSGYSAFWGCSFDTVEICDLSAFLRADFDIYENTYESMSNPIYCTEKILLDGEELWDIVIPADITEIKANAFLHSPIRSVKIHDGVTSIEKYAFAFCDELHTVEFLMNECEIIDASAFYYTTNVLLCINGSGVGEEQISAWFPNLKDILSPSDPYPIRMDENGFVFYDGQECLLIDYMGEAVDILLPKYYGDRAYSVLQMSFHDNDAIQNVTIPSTVLAIEKGAFTDCDGLRTFTMEEGLDVSTSGIVSGERLHTARTAYIGNVVGTDCPSMHSLFVHMQQMLEDVRYVDYPLALRVLGLPEGSLMSQCTDPTILMYRHPIGLGIYEWWCVNDTFGYNHQSYDEPSVIIRQDGFLFCKVKNDDYNYILLGYEGEATDVAIPELVNSDPDTRICIKSYTFYRSHITSLVIPETVVKIQENAFSECQKLQNIDMQITACNVEKDAFVGMDHLLEDGCIGDVLISLQKPFYGYEAWIKEGVATVTGSGDNTMQAGEHRNVKYIYLPSTLRWIGDYAFQNFEDLEEIVIPEGVVYIGENAFAYCDNLKRVYIPSTVRYIDVNAFYGSVAIEQVVLANDNPWFEIREGCLIEKETRTLLLTVDTPQTKVPMDVQYIAPGAFANAGENVIIPEGALDLPQRMLEYTECDMVYVPETVTEGSPMWLQYVSTKLLVCGKEVPSFYYTDSSGEILFDSLYCASKSTSKTMVDALTGIALRTDVKNATEDYIKGKFEYCETITFMDKEYILYSHCNHEWEEYIFMYGDEYVDCERCSECGARRDAGEHQLLFVSYQAPTCGEDGYYLLFCSVCNEQKKMIVRATGRHTYGLWEASVPFGHLTYGEDQRVCTECGDTITRVTPYGGHYYTYVENRTVSCFEDGYTLYRCICGAEEKRNITPAYGDHDYNRAQWHVSVPKTCTEDGREDLICLRCWEILDTRVIPASHDIVYIEGVLPTCTSEGYEAYDYCWRCEENTPDVILPSLPHEYLPEYLISETTCVEAERWYAVCSGCDRGEIIRVGEPLGHDLKNTPKAPTCTENGYEEYWTCSRCYYRDGILIPATGHTYEAIVTSPTCREEGYTTYTCHCGDTYVGDYTGRIPHEFGQERVIMAPTCEMAGWAAKTCLHCPYEYHYTLATLPHQWITVEAQNPTCTSDGWYAYHWCTGCGASDIIIRPATGHNYRYHSNVSAGCLDDGYTVYQCDRCESLYMDDYEKALGHSYTVWSIVTEATCEADGLQLSKCDRCGTEQTKIIKASGHELNYFQAVDPTCTNDGFLEYEACLKCDYSTKVVLEAKGHAYQIRVVAPTCTAQGYTLHRCHCGFSYKDEYQTPTGHNLQEQVMMDPTCEHRGEAHVWCVNCSYTEYKVLPQLKHNTVVVEGTLPTCEMPGYDSYVRCTNCPYSTRVDLPPLGHTYESTVIEPTCESEGYTKFLCNCGYSYTADIIDRLPHELCYVAAQPPTCTDDGWNDYEHCINCSYTTRESVPARGHSLSDWEIVISPECIKTGLKQRICLDCGIGVEEEIVPARNHVLNYYPALSPTCTEAGHNAYEECVNCPYSTRELISALGHSMGEFVWSIIPNCTSAGERYKECGICGQIAERETVEKIPHTLVFEKAKVPTCTEDGYNAHEKCENCAYTTRVDQPAKGHILSDWIFSEGILLKECLRCHEILESEVADADGIERFCESMEGITETRTNPQQHFEKISIALGYYQLLGEAEKPIVEDLYGELCEEIEFYNDLASSCNEEHNSIVRIVFETFISFTLVLSLAYTVLSKRM